MDHAIHCIRRLYPSCVSTTHTHRNTGKGNELTLAINSTPPLTSPNATNTSVGGRPGYLDVGGFSHMTTYVSPLANDAPASNWPHCLCTMVETTLSCLCDDMSEPSRRITSAGTGFVEVR